MILVKPCFGCLQRRKRAAFQRLAREEKVYSLLWAAGEPQRYATEPHVPAAIPSLAKSSIGYVSFTASTSTIPPATEGRESPFAPAES